MKKLARMACLVAALVLSGVATAGALPYGYCYYSCGGGYVYTYTEYESCCGTQIRCSDGSYSYAVWFQGIYGGEDVCQVW